MIIEMVLVKDFVQPVVEGVRRCPDHVTAGNPESFLPLPLAACPYGHTLFCGK